MRARFLVLLCLAASAQPALAEPPPRPPAKAPPPIGCASLANYRILMRQGGDAAGAAAVLADPKADHLGCAPIARETVTGIADHIALDGQGYDCIGLSTTSTCQWVAAGSVRPPADRPAKADPAKRPPAAR